MVYRERLSHWPYSINEAGADFQVKKLHENKRGQYLVESTHRTCFFGGFYCCKLSSNLSFRTIKNVRFFNFFNHSIAQCIQLVNFFFRQWAQIHIVWKIFTMNVLHFWVACADKKLHSNGKLLCEI